MLWRRIEPGERRGICYRYSRRKGGCCGSKFEGDWSSGTGESARSYNILHLSQPHNSGGGWIPPPTIHNFLSREKAENVSNIAVIRSGLGTQPLSWERAVPLPMAGLRC